MLDRAAEAKKTEDTTSTLEETIIKKPPKGGWQDRGAATGETPKGNNQGRETTETHTTNEKEEIIKTKTIARREATLKKPDNEHPPEPTGTQ